MAKTNATKRPVKKAENADLLTLVQAQQDKLHEQQEQIDGLQQGYLQMINVMREMSAQIVRLQRHSGIGASSIAIPSISDVRRFQK